VTTCSRATSVPRAHRVVHNPVVTEPKLAASWLPPAHPWFAATEIPVILGVRRLVPQKDFALLRASLACGANAPRGW
jgi:hypothetical protein